MSPLHRWAAVLLTAAFTATAPAAEVDKFLLDDTDGVLAVNVRQIFDSPLYKKVYQAPLQKALKGDTILTMVQSFGVDLFKDVDTVYVVHGESSHRVVKKGDSDGGLCFVVRGRVDPAKVHARAAQLAREQPKLVRTHKEANGIIYEVPLSKPLYLAVPDKTALVASFFKDQVSDALDKGAGKKQTQLKNKEVQALIEKADDKQALWLLATGSMAYAIEQGAKQTLTGVGVTEASGGVTVSDGVKSSFTVTTRDEATARKVVGSLQMDLNEVLERLFQSQLDNKKATPLRDFFRKLAITSADKTVTIQNEIEGQVFEESLK